MQNFLRVYKHALCSLTGWAPSSSKGAVCTEGHTLEVDPKGAYLTVIPRFSGPF